MRTYTDRVSIIARVARSGTPEKLDNHYIDKFTAKLLLLIIHKLTNNMDDAKTAYAKAEQFILLPIEKMIAVAYKIVNK